MNGDGAADGAREKARRSRSRGNLGESLALEYLTRRGYSAVERGFHTRYGEIDLIVSDSCYVVFVEVKLRKSDAYARAGEFVGRGKQRKIKATAMLWLASHETALQPRFDVVEVYVREYASAASARINHIEDAFQ